MSTLAKKSVKPCRKSGSSKTTRSSSAAAPAQIASHGDLARATFARWDREHNDPKPMKWEKLQSVLEENRLREAPLFSE